MERNIWNDFIKDLSNPHFLQTYEWGQVKAQGGWQPFYALWSDSGFQISSQLSELDFDKSQVRAAALILKKSVLRRSFATQLCILYCPKGPNLDWSDEPLRKRVLDDLQAFACRQGGIFLKLDPDVVLGRGVPGTEDAQDGPLGAVIQKELSARGWRYSDEQIQFKNTVLVDVAPGEEDILARMKQKTRYNVRLGPKKGVSVRSGALVDLPMLYQMYAETSVRDGFVIRDEAYYRLVWETFMRQGMAEPLIAEVEGEPVAAVFVFAFGKRAYYVYGMSREAHREKMPTYLLQWEAMRWAKARGCSVYDLWGAPDVFDESDSMWGVFRFKEGLGGQVVHTLGAWDFVPNALWYALYTQVMPRVLDVMRSRGRTRTKLQIDA